MDEGQRPIYLDMQATTPVDPRVDVRGGRQCEVNGPLDLIQG